MMDLIAQVDILGLAATLGATLFLAAIIWVLVDNRSFEGLDRAHDVQDAHPPYPDGATRPGRDFGRRRAA